MKRSASTALWLALALGAFNIGAASAQDARPVIAAVPAALPADVGSVDGVIAALYDVISGPAGKPRDWNRLRSLFAPQGKMMAVGVRPDGSSPATVMTVDDYIARVTFDGQEGWGIFEHASIGPHAPSGFTDYLDGAP